jgi:hypothetical protein
MRCGVFPVRSKKDAITEAEAVAIVARAISGAVHTIVLRYLKIIR